MNILIKDEIDLLNSDHPTTEYVTDSIPISPSNPRQYILEDRTWREYVSQLAPDDESGAFLLPDELPKEGSTPRQIRSAIGIATRRALGIRHRFLIKDYVLGRIRGEMRVLLPQGREISYHFNDELGWKATVVIDADNEEETFVAYYRQKCMNIARIVAYLGGQLDTSRVVFTPLDTKESEQIVTNSELDRAIDRNLMRLRRKYLAKSI